MLESLLSIIPFGGAVQTSSQICGHDCITALKKKKIEITSLFESSQYVANQV